MTFSLNQEQKLQKLEGEMEKSKKRQRNKALALKKNNNKQLKFATKRNRNVIGREERTQEGKDEKGALVSEPLNGWIRKA